MFVEHKIFSNTGVFLYAIIAFNIVSEGNIRINRYFEKKELRLFRVSSRIAKQLFLSLIWTTFIGILFYNIIPHRHQELENYTKGFILTFTYGALFVLIFNAVLFIRSFIFHWKASLLENEKLKREKLQSDYAALQNQLNPHFLFNNLSVLISEIHFNPEKAEEFARKMADIYRYVLQNKDRSEVTLNEELQFIENYIFLHNIRLGHAIDLEVKITGEQKRINIPPLTLQILIENAIKHNRVSAKEPLNINIYVEKAYIDVVNVLQKKGTTYSTGTGLKNLKERYKLLYGCEISYGEVSSEFRVHLPVAE